MPELLGNWSKLLCPMLFAQFPAVLGRFPSLESLGHRATGLFQAQAKAQTVFRL